MNSKSILQVITLTVFILSLQGCSSSNDFENETVVETPQIEESATVQSNGSSEVVVQGEPGSTVYVNGKEVGIISPEGTAVIELELPEGGENALHTLVVKDESGNVSEEVVFTLSTETVDSTETNSSEENSEEESNTSTPSSESTDSNSSTNDTNQSVSSEVTEPEVNVPSKGVTTSNPTVNVPKDDSNSTDTNSSTASPEHNSTTSVVILKSLALTAADTTLNKDANTTVKVIATFSDNSTKEVTESITWTVTPNDALRMKKQNLKALQDGNITLQAKLGSTTSNILHVNVFWEVNGYRLPPMPDEKLNNATLLGIDVNSNGVRDDVERYLLEKYKDHHKIVSEIALQSGRAYQIVLENPEDARETTKFMDAAQDCNWYFKKDADYYGDVILINDEIMDYKFEDLQLNTKERVKAYLAYNRNLSGGVYRLTPSSKRKGSM